MDEFQLIIDYREKALIECGSICVPFTQQNLDIGDFNIVKKDTNDVCYVLERKTVSDLIASIKDGRYIEQKTRAVSIYGVRKFAYIIEKNNNFNWNTEDKQVRTAIINTMLRDNIHVFFTDDLCDTCYLINDIFNKFKIYDNNDFCISENKYIQSSIKSKKSENIKDFKIVTKIQLSNIPGVSLNNAESILSEFKVEKMQSLIDVFKEEQEKGTLKKRLLHIPGIGKNKVNNLISYLLN